MNDEKKKELTALLDRHPEMYDRILQLLKAHIPDSEATQEQHQAND